MIGVYKDNNFDVVWAATATSYNLVDTLSYIIYYNTMQFDRFAIFIGLQFTHDHLFHPKFCISNTTCTVDKHNI